MLSGAVTRVAAQNTEVGGAIFLDYTVSNTGNVAWQPTQIVSTFTNVDNASDTYQVVFSGTDIPSVTPSNVPQVVHLQKAHRVPVGSYKPVVTVVTPDQKTTDFSLSPIKVFPENTLMQKGDLIDATAVATQYEAGDTINTKTTFLNTGDVPLQATVVYEILRDGKLLDTKQSDPVLIGLKEQTVIRHSFSFPDPGTYVIQVHVEYGVKSTITKTITLTVTKPAAVWKQEANNAPLLTMIAIAALVLLGGGWILIRWIIKRKGAVTTTTTAVSAPSVSTPAAAPVQLPLPPQAPQTPPSVPPPQPPTPPSPPTV